MILRLTLAAAFGLFSIHPDVVSGLNLNQNVPFTRHQRSGQTALGYANEGAAVSETTTPGLVGQILNGQYLISANIPVASTKCQIYEAYRLDDPQKQKPMIVKLSPHTDRIGIEYRNYKAIADRLGFANKNLFVEIYDTIEPTPLTQDCAGIVMEKGEDNLRFDIMNNGLYQGDKLRNAMETVIRIVGSLHDEGIVWTEIKAENFVVVPQQGGGSSSTIKGIDLESAISQNDLLAMYTAEACPPEFPVDDMYQCLPKIRMEYSFDMWGLGMTLFEMATGKPFYADGLTDLEYIKNRLRNPEEMISDLENKLFAVDLEARSVIKQCLMVDPRARSSCQDLLKTPYFTQNNKPSFASIPSSNFGIPSKTATQDQLQTTMQAQYDQEAQRTVLMEQIVELENQLKLSDVSNHQLQEELSATKSEIKAWKEHKDEVNNLRANIKEASEERAVMMESIRNKTEQRLSEATQSLSDVQSQLASAKEEVASLLSDNKSLLSQISAMTASREAILSNLKEMEVIVDATKNSASIATFAEAKVVNQVGISRLQETQNEVTAHLQHHDMLQHIQNEKLPHRTELQDPNPHTLQPLRFEDRLASVLDVINACALHDPDVAKDLLSILEQSQNGLSPRMTL